MDEKRNSEPVVEVHTPDATLLESTNAHELKPKPKPDPTRYGDWVVNGRCIDF